MSTAVSLLLDSALRGGLLSVSVWIVFLVFGRRFSAAVRHCCLACALLVLALTPVFIAGFDGWRILPPLSKATTSSVTNLTTTQPGIEPQKITPVPSDMPQGGRHQESSIESTKVSQFQWPQWQTWLIGSWGVVMFGLIALIGKEILKLHRLRRSAQSRKSEELASCARALGLSRVPEMLLMKNDTGPLVSGYFRPVVLLPADTFEWPTERIRAVMLHELAHVKRRDGLVHLIGALICAMHWFNPIAWLLFKHLRHEAECACDDVVLNADMPALSYADHLLAVASGGRCASSLAPSMAQPSGLRQRMQAVLSNAVRRGAVSRFVGFAIIILGVCSSLPFMLAQTAQPKTVEKDAVSIVCVDEKGQPVGHVEIRGFDCDEPGPLDPFIPSFVVMTDAQGYWTGNLQPHQYLYLGTKGTLVTNESAWDHSESKPPFQRTLVMRPGGEVQITVKDAASHKMIVNAHLIMDSGHTAVTDAHGRAHMLAVPKGERVLTVVSPPYADRTVDFNSTGQSSIEVEALMSPGFEVRGRVVDGEGHPVKGAVVRDNYSSRTFAYHMNRCLTDAEGNYQLGWYPKSQPLWWISANHEDYAEQSKMDLSPPVSSDTAHWNFVMDPGHEISGLVVDESGNAIKGAYVRYLSAPHSALCDEQGRFRLIKIATDREGAVLAIANGYVSAWQSTRPGKGNDVPELKFIMKRGLTVKGRVVDRYNKSVNKMYVSLLVKIDGRMEFAGKQVQSDSNGEFELTGVPESGVAIRGSHANYSLISKFPFDPAKPLLVIADRPGVIVGKVVDATTRQPVKKFNVRLDIPKAARAADEIDDSFSIHLLNNGQNSSSDDGRFVIENLTARAGHEVHVLAEGYSEMVIDKVIARPIDDKAWPLEIAMDRGIEVKGKLVDAVTGAPVGGAKVFYVAKDRWDGTIIYSFLNNLRRYSSYDDVVITKADASGNVEIHFSGNPSAYTVLIQADGYAPQWIDRQPITQTQLQMKPMQREARLRGTVAGLEGFDPAKDGLYIVMDSNDYHHDEISAQPDGTFEVAGLPAGKASILARNPTGQVIKGSAIVDLVAGQTTTVDLPAVSKSSVKVIVTMDGKPLEGVEISVSSSQPYFHVGARKTEKDGTAILRYLPSVKAEVSYRDVKNSMRPSQPLDLTNPNETPVIRFDLKSELPPK